MSEILAAATEEYVIPLLLGGGLLTAMVAMYKARPERDVAISAAYSKLVTDLRTRIEDLEEDLREERVECETKIDALTERVEELAAQLAQHES